MGGGELLRERKKNPLYHLATFYKNTVFRLKVNRGDAGSELCGQ